MHHVDDLVEFTLTYISHDLKIKAIKTIRDCFDLSLKEAKTIVEEADAYSFSDPFQESTVRIRATFDQFGRLVATNREGSATELMFSISNIETYKVRASVLDLSHHTPRFLKG